jgi:hypothetical protein
MLVFTTDISMAIDKERKERREKKEQRVIVRKKLDMRSRAQKRKDRNILCLIALAGFLVIKHIEESP